MSAAVQVKAWGVEAAADGAVAGGEVAVAVPTEFSATTVLPEAVTCFPFSWVQ